MTDPDKIIPALQLNEGQIEAAMDIAVDRAIEERVPIVLAGMRRRSSEVVLVRGASPGRYPGGLLIVPDAVESAARLRGKVLPRPIRRLTRKDGRAVLVYEVPAQTSSWGPLAN
jgi:hypothetical protein